MSDLVLGLDIGIGSVGVGILNKVTGEIIHKTHGSSQQLKRKIT